MHVLKHYNWEQNLEKMLTVYKSLNKA